MYYLQGYGAESKLGREEQSIYLSSIMNSERTRIFNLNTFDVDILKKCSLMVGSVEMIELALSALGIAIPKPNYYPEVLSEFFHRKIIPSDVNGLRERLLCGESWFAKPRLTWKKFTGQIFDSNTGAEILDSLDDSFELWLSEIVEFESEYRCYVINGKLIACCQYSGEKDDAPSCKVINRSIELLLSSPDTPASYTLDVGKLSTGETVLVELGDGFSVGKYKGITDVEYLAFLKERWDQLVQKNQTA